MVRIVATDGSTPEGKLSQILSRIVLKDYSKTIAASIQKTTQQHISSRFPGSKHWDPSKVTIQKTGDNEAEVQVDIPGAGRAYHDVDIWPKNGSYLTIPMSEIAIGHSAKEFDLFFLQKKNGNSFLARKSGSGIEFMYFLTKHVHQSQDRSLMPSDDTLISQIINSIAEEIYKENNAGNR